MYRCWLYTKRRGVVIQHLERSEYVEIDSSQAFPQLTAVQLNRFVIEYQDDIQLNRDIRSWLQSLN